MAGKISSQGAGAWNQDGACLLEGRRRIDVFFAFMGMHGEDYGLLRTGLRVEQEREGIWVDHCRFCGQSRMGSC